MTSFGTVEYETYRKPQAGVAIHSIGWSKEESFIVK
jgi:hypothetical protein